MKQLALVLAILGTAGAWVADLLLLGVPAFRNGWWTLALFAVPAALIVLAWGGEENKKLRVGAAVVFLVGLGGWVALRLSGRLPDTVPAVTVGDRAPNFTLKDQDGKNISLSDFTADGRVVLIFFRGKT